MALQYLTTREPDDGMLEVALVSFLAAEDKKTDEEIDKMARDYSHKIDGSPADFADAADAAKAEAAPEGLTASALEINE